MCVCMCVWVGGCECTCSGTVDSVQVVVVMQSSLSTSFAQTAPGLSGFVRIHK